jgi:hypothetical protein
MLLILPSAATGQVTIHPTEIVVEHHEFDPKDPPAEMPKLKPNEGSITQTYFWADPKIKAALVEKKANASGCELSMSIQGVDMTVRLQVHVWVPKGAVPKVVKHEEGHVQIAQRYYADAETIAREIAQSFIGKTVTATGADENTASRAALRQAADAISQMYLARTDVIAKKAQDEYDRITAHGTNAIPEARAIEQAIAKVAVEATTLPSTKP